MVVIQPVVLPVGALPVYWDINKCPVPAGCDARRVGPCIEGFLRKLGHSGPISITAIGKLSKVPKEILEAVSSTGIRLYDVPYGRKNIRNHISLYFALNCLDPVATHVMLISPPRDFHVLISYLYRKERHIILPFPFESSKTLANVLWTKLLLEEDVKCSETVEPANWVCGVCGNLPGQGFENFWTHLLSQEHDLEIFPWFGNYGEPVIPLPTAKATNVEQRTPQEHAPAPPPGHMFPWFGTTNVEQKTPSQEYALEMFPRFGTTNVEQKTPSQEISPSFGNDTFLDPGSPSQGHALGVIKLPSQVLSWSKPLQTAKATNVEQRTPYRRSRMSERPSAATSWEEAWVEATNVLNGLF